MKISYVLVLATGVSFIANILIIPLLLHLSHRFKWYDDVDHRKIHTGEIPRIGGVGIFLSFLLGFASFLSAVWPSAVNQNRVTFLRDACKNLV